MENLSLTGFLTHYMLTCMSQPSPLYLLLQQKLGEPLADFIRERREAGRAWRLIAIELTQRTGIDVTYETVRTWSQGREPVAAVEAPVSAA